jgi:hypothetical protein
METSNFYLSKAAQCRRLAATIITGDDPAIAALVALAREFEARAIAQARCETNAMRAHHPPCAKPKASDGSNGG